MFSFYFFDDPYLREGIIMSQALRTPLEKTSISRMKTFYRISDVKAVAEYEEYINEVLSPLLTSVDGRLGGNLLLGALRIRTQRVKQNSCYLIDTVIPRSVSSSITNCRGLYKPSAEDRGVEMRASLYNHSYWDYKSCEEMGGVSWSGLMANYHCGGYYFDVPFYTDANITQKRYIFKNEKWKLMPTKNFTQLLSLRFKAAYPLLDDSATRFVSTEFYVYNPAARLLGSVKVLSEVGSGGLWICSVVVNTFHYWTTDDSGRFAYTIAFLVVVSLLTVAQLHQLVSRILAGSMSFSTTSVFVSLYRLVVLFLLITSIVMTLVVMQRLRSTDFNLAEVTYSGEYPVFLEHLCEMSIQTHYINGFITILLFNNLVYYLRLFKWASNVVDTISRAASTLIGIVLLFSLSLTVFAMTAYVYLHRTVWEFRSVNRSFQTLFYLLIRQIDINVVFARVTNSQSQATKFILFAFVFVNASIILALFVGVLRVSFTVTRELESATPDMHYALQYIKAVMRHPKRWPRFVIQYVFGLGEAELLYQCGERLAHYRRVVYPVEVNKTELSTHILTQERFDEAIRVETKENDAYPKLSLWSQIRKGAALFPFPPGLQASLWRELRAEWENTKLSRQSQKIKDEVWWTSEGVQQTLESHIMLVKEFPRRLYDLEGRLYEVKNKLTAEEQTDIPGSISTSQSVSSGET
ncbi:Polycystin cation channel, putative [Angomonas deanei]|uniref:Polycystin cation channel, putative n=1 Tax=Angomonas deanei TaxID=59799 RepID=A0A7G2CGS3_9TRYP|nr:Polycystin cation channel, putative [Angomonas deanei]